MNGEDTSAAVPATDKQAEEDLWQRYGAERGIWTESMLIALERGLKGNKWFSLIDKVASVRTLGIAWAKVQSNAGACGVDGITVGYFSKDSESRLLAVNEQIKEGRYQPKPIRRVHIPKLGSAETRPLGIPTVRDRVVQSAIKLVIEPIFEKEFAWTSYGFRPGRGCKDALREAERLLRGGRVHVVDVDIKGYFDNIPHDKLMALVRQRIADGKVLGLIEGFLKQGVLEDGIIKGWFGYFKHAHQSELQRMDAWVRMRLRSILRKRRKGSGRGRGLDHFRWPNRYFENLGLFSLKDAREETVSLLRGAKR
jgi:RNA-directed DNA polymerase